MVEVEAGKLAVSAEVGGLQADRALVRLLRAAGVAREQQAPPRPDPSLQPRTVRRSESSLASYSSPLLDDPPYSGRLRLPFFGGPSDACFVAAFLGFPRAPP